MKNLDSIKTKKGEIKKPIINAIKFMHFDKGNKIRPCRWMNKGRNLEDKSQYFIDALNAGGYKYKIGNDAPRGGQEGLFIKISNVAYNFLKSLL